MQRVFASLFSTLSLAILSCLIPVAAKAQVTPDGTTSTTVNQNGNDFFIEQGDRVGDNLFHSFDEFSVPNSGSAGFNNAGDIANIFSRVTGSNISNINGLISTNGVANLYLINPNGIIFGENARLDLGGSFFASTADSLLLEGNTEFSAVDPNAAPLLEVSIPIGLNFRDNPGDIVANPSSVLFVESEQTIALVGGNVSLNGASVIGSTLGTGNTIEIGGLTEAGVVGFQTDGLLDFPVSVARGDVSLINGSVLNTVSRGEGIISIHARNLSLATDSTIANGILLDADTTRVSSGRIVVDATGDVAIDGANSDTLTAIFNSVADTTGGTGTGIGEAGNIEISARNISLINGGSVASAVFNPNQSENTTEPNRSSNIILTAEESILVEDSNSRFPSSISNQINFGNGNGGAIDLTAQNLFLRDGATIGSTIDLNAEGIAGNMNLEIGNLVLSTGGQINANSFGGGDGGNIDIIADTISVDGSGDNLFLNNSPSRISSSTQLNALDIVNEELGIGNAGDINISTNSLSITNGAELLAESDSLGDGGDIQIVATENILVDGGTDRILTQLGNNTGSFFNTSGIGNAGNIEISTPRLRVVNNGVVSAATFNEGNAGNININASNLLEVSNESVIVSDVFAGATGSGGNLIIETANLKIAEGGQVNVTTRGEGDAGNLTVRASNSVEIAGTDEFGFRSNLSANALNSTGNSGELNVFTKNLTIADDAIINVGNFPSSENSISNPGTGEPGNLNIQARSIDLENGASITAATQSSTGDGANINLTIAEDLLLENNTLLSARAFEDADGGNLTINADNGFILAFPDSNNDVIANAEQGNGGNININTQAIFGLSERSSTPDNSTNDINASSEFGLQGNIDINNPAVDPTTGLIDLPASVGDATDQISQNPCQQGVGSQFIVTGKGGLPPNVNESLNSESTRVDLIEPVPSTSGEAEERESQETEENLSTEAVPAQGWVFNDRGEVTLTAYATSAKQIQRPVPKNSSTCKR